jgi:hypothetical protein
MDAPLRVTRRCGHHSSGIAMSTDRGRFRSGSASGIMAD